MSNRNSNHQKALVFARLIFNLSWRHKYDQSQTRNRVCYIFPQYIMSIWHTVGPPNPNQKCQTKNVLANQDHLVNQIMVNQLPNSRNQSRKILWNHASLPCHMRLSLQHCLSVSMAHTVWVMSMTSRNLKIKLFVWVTKSYQNTNVQLFSVLDVWNPIERWVLVSFGLCHVLTNLPKLTWEQSVLMCHHKKFLPR